MGLYATTKQIGRPQKGDKKPKAIKTVSDEQWVSILQAVEDSSKINPRWERDYAIIFLGAALGMRRGEICLYERDHFRDLNQYDVIHVPTLKRSERIQYTCKGTTADGDKCERKVRVKASSAGHMHRCYRCGKYGEVPKLPNGRESSGVVLVDVDIVEEKTVGFILDYIERMRPDQRFLFESKPGYHISDGHVNRIFNTFTLAAGLDPKISFHSLRHNRGVMMWSRFGDMILCRDALRHRDIKTTQIYADLDLEKKEKYKAELDKRAFDPLKKRRQK